MKLIQLEICHWYKWNKTILCKDKRTSTKEDLIWLCIIVKEVKYKRKQEAAKSLYITEIWEEEELNRRRQRKKSGWNEHWPWLNRCESRIVSAQTWILLKFCKRFLVLMMIFIEQKNSCAFHIDIKIMADLIERNLKYVWHRQAMKFSTETCQMSIGNNHRHREKKRFN